VEREIVFRRILVGFDGSRDAREALRAGAALALIAGGEVTAAIVVSHSHGETEEERRAAFESESAPLRAAAERDLAAATRSKISSSIHVLSGDHPAAALSRYASEHGFDLLVMGRHGRERAAHGGLGRIARELAEKALCPLLLVGDGDPGDSEHERPQC
jgi:nucleotide-binding universal stress UspA family protein